MNPHERERTWEALVAVAETLMQDDKLRAEHGDDRLRAAHQALVQAAQMANLDLRIWHDKSLSYQTSAGGYAYGNCRGCTTCEDTLPAIEAALKQAQEARHDH